MKYSALILIAITFFAACKSETKSGPDHDPTEVTLPTTELESAKVLDDGLYCYQYVIKKDTYDINFNLINGAVEGDMSFKNYEKDSSKGKIKGYIKDDILTVNYRFNSEGMSSVRNINFKVRGEILITGIGEETSVGDSAFIKDISTIKYEGLVYSKIPCAN